MKADIGKMVPVNSYRLFTRDKNWVIKGILEIGRYYAYKNRAIKGI